MLCRLDISTLFMSFAVSDLRPLEIYKNHGDSIISLCKNVGLPLATTFTVTSQAMVSGLNLKICL